MKGLRGGEVRWGEGEEGGDGRKVEDVFLSPISLCMYLCMYLSVFLSIYTCIKRNSR